MGGYQRNSYVPVDSMSIFCRIVETILSISTGSSQSPLTGGAPVLHDGALPKLMPFERQNLASPSLSAPYCPGPGVKAGDGGQCLERKDHLGMLFTKRYVPPSPF